MSPWPPHTTLLIDWLPAPGLNPLPRTSGFTCPSSPHTHTHAYKSLQLWTGLWSVCLPCFDDKFSRGAAANIKSSHTVRWLKVRAYCCWRTHILLCFYVNFKCSYHTGKYRCYVDSPVHMLSCTFSGAFLWFSSVQQHTVIFLSIVCCSFAAVDWGLPSCLNMTTLRCAHSEVCIEMVCLLV